MRTLCCTAGYVALCHPKASRPAIAIQCFVVLLFLLIGLHPCNGIGMAFASVLSCSTKRAYTWLVASSIIATRYSFGPRSSNQACSR
jgi:p-aminobenzoyl-glutamate transporter AbgT